MPQKNMRIAMNLYQPSGSKGKVVKNLFPLLHWLPLARNIIHATPTQCRLNKKLNNLLEQIFQESNLEFAIFFGTPCVHQKLTMQISKGNRILGYCKATDSADIASLFSREQNILNLLENKQMNGLPRCLYCGQLDTNCHLFIQSTSKTQKSKVLHDWSPLHEAFLQQLETHTRQEILFEESDYFKTLSDLQQHIHWLPQQLDKNFVLKIIEKTLAVNKGKRVSYSAYHADFTPWNMFVESGNLFVFDWEYAKTTYPPQLDKYHFFTQTAIFEKHWQAKNIIQFLQSPHANWIDKEKYTLYLLDVISRFSVREKGNISGDVATSFSLWSNLLEYLNK